MAVVNLLEEFEPAPSAQTGGQAAPALTEEDRAAAYEQGYAAGWDDAVRAEEEAQGRISAEFARNLQDLGFTFHEARAHVLRAFAPLLDELVRTFVPRMAAAALGPMIREELTALAEEVADTRVELLVPPGAGDRLRPLLADIDTLPVEIVEEDSLAEGQALLRTPRLQRRIDLQEAAERVAAALEAFHQIQEKEDAI